MCFGFSAKGEIDVDDQLPPVQIRRRYSTARNETILEIVRPVKKCATLFWFCSCGCRMHIDILICKVCGRHRHHNHGLPTEVDKVEKAYEALRKELGTLEKNLKEIEKDCCNKNDGSKDKKSEDDCCQCEKKKTEEKKCRCEEMKEKRTCDCAKPPAPPLPPKPTPVPSQPPFIPVIPAPWPLPKPDEPEIKPECPVPEPPVVNVIVPDYHRRRRRKRSPSISSSSTRSSRSFERIKHRVTGLTRRVCGLEGREYVRDERDRIRLIEEERHEKLAEDERARQREELARERARERELESGRERARERAYWRRRECLNDQLPDPVRIMPFPYPVVEPPRPLPFMQGGFRRGWPVRGRWEESCELFGP